MKLQIDRFRARRGKVKLSQHPTRVDNFYDDDDDAKAKLAHQVGRIEELQTLLYAANSWSLLLVFQAMDAAGKDSTIKNVLSGVNPQGCQVYSFKQPSAAELDHDFLWRTALCLPERGRIGVFNRSYYEEVLVVRVHPQYLAAQRVPDGDASRKRFWKHRFESIRDHEKHLHRNGTKVVKFFLNVSLEEQRQRFLARIDDPTKNWKFSLGDVEERKFWPDYQSAYEDAIAATSTADSPWYVVPADDKPNARLIVARIIADTIEALAPQFPVSPDAQRAELRRARSQLSRGR
ncbi:MAG: polyphosphate kinase 2 family protein [Steroidobacteraceae bacterium]